MADAQEDDKDKKTSNSFSVIIAVILLILWLSILHQRDHPAGSTPGPGSSSPAR